MNYSHIRPARGTYNEWRTLNPVLADGEFAVEKPEQGDILGNYRFKFGDGVHHWNDLRYAGDVAKAEVDYDPNTETILI